MIATERTSAVTLHVRPSARLIDLVSGFRARIMVGPANARRMDQILAARIKAGDTVTIRADGPDEGAALAMVDEYLGEPA